MTSIADNQAISDPRKALTKAEQTALQAIGFFRYQHYSNGKWQIGNKRFDVTTIRSLEQKGLVKSKHAALDLTMGGKLASDRLKGGGHGPH